jgi:hypothetical protein
LSCRRSSVPPAARKDLRAAWAITGVLVSAIRHRPD